MQTPLLRPAAGPGTPVADPVARTQPAPRRQRREAAQRRLPPRNEVRDASPCSNTTNGSAKLLRMTKRRLVAVSMTAPPCEGRTARSPVSSVAGRGGCWMPGQTWNARHAEVAYAAGQTLR